MRVVLSRPRAPSGMLVAHAELWFEEGEPLAGMRLIGFDVWRVSDPHQFTVTMPQSHAGFTAPNLLPQKGQTSAEEEALERLILNEYHAWARSEDAKEERPAGRSVGQSNAW